MNRCLLFLVVFCSVLMGFYPAAMAHTDISIPDANDLISSNSDLIIIDVRENSEYCGEMGHVPGALLYPWSSEVLQNSYKDLLRNDEILVVCRSGSRSNTAANFLDSNGYKHVYDMLGGTRDWKNEYEYETVGCVDSDEDGFNDDLDNCPSVYNPRQTDTDNDQVGNVCDIGCPDIDELNPVNVVDLAILAANWHQSGEDLAGDFNSDKLVDIDDLIIFACYWLSECQI